MPAISTTEANRTEKTEKTAPKRKVKVRAKKPKVKVVVTVPDAHEETRTHEPRQTGKVRMYAHPTRPAAQKVFKKQADDDAAAARKRAQVRSQVSRIKVTPVPSPDARDSTRSAEQRRKDAVAANTNAYEAKERADKNKRLAKVGGHVDRYGKVKIVDVEASKAAAAKQAQTSFAPVLKTLEQTTRVNHAIAGGADAAVTGKDISSGITRGIQNKDKKTFSDVLGHAGWNPKSGAGKTAKAVTATALDIGTDPTTYATLGLSSAAKQAAAKAARQAEKEAAKSAAAKTSAQKAEAQAVKRGATPKAAKKAGQQAVKVHAQRAGKKAGDAAAVGKATNSGARISLAGRDVPLVTRTTAAVKRTPRAVARKTRVENTRVGRKVDRAQQRVRDTSRNFASDFNPAIAPAGVDRELYQSARRSARTARAGAQRGTFKAGQRAIAFRDAIGKKNYETVIDAIETGTIPSLPKHLRGPARELQRDFAQMRKAERRAGLKVGDKGETYVKHLRITDPPRGGVPAVGSKKVDPGFGKSRIEGTIAEKNAREPGAYSTDIGDIYLNRGAESAVARSKAKLNQAMVDAGRKPNRHYTIKEQLGDNETLYKVDGANLVKVDPKSAEAKALPKGTRFVILNEKLISRTRGTVAAAAERSTSGVFFDKAQGVWKLTATQVNPGYHVRNFAGEAQNAYLAENPITLGRNAVQAARALRQLGRDEDALRVLGKKPKENKHTALIREAESVGAVRAGALGREVQDMLGSQSKKNGRLKVRRRAITRKPARALKNVEDVFRLATYKGGRDRGLKPEHAMERASKYHFDYGDLTPLERTFLRRAAPFWTFSARNIPLQARTLLTKPSKFANYQKIRENLQAAFGVPDDWENDLSESEQRAAPFPVKINGKTYNIGLGPSGLPLTDLNEFPATLNPAKQADEWMERAMSMLTPAAKTPVELWSNFSFFFREPIEREQGPLTPAPSWVQHIPEKYRNQLGITPNYRDPRTGKSGWGAPAKIVYAIGVLPGPIAFGNRFMTDSDRPGQSKAAKTVQYFGPRVRQNDPTTVTINRLFEQRGKAKKKAATLGQQNIPGTTIKVSAKTPTGEYRKALNDVKAIELKIAMLRRQRGDKDPSLYKQSRRTSGVDKYGLPTGGGVPSLPKIKLP